MLLGPSYDKPLDEMIVDVKAQLQAVEQRIGFLRDQDITRTRATTADMNSSVRNIRSDLNDLKESHHMHSTMVLNKVDKLHSRIDSSKGMVEHLYDTLCNAECKLVWSVSTHSPLTTIQGFGKRKNGKRKGQNGKGKRKDCLGS